MELSRERSLDGRGLLYPLMVIAAIAVIVFSLVGIATVSGWLPSALANSDSAGEHSNTPRSGVAFECAECGVLESMRDIQRPDRGDSRAAVVASVSP